MPWAPELFSAPALARVWEDERRRRLALVPFFAGLMTGETDAVIDSFAGEPELYHPVRGRIKGVAAFERFIRETRTWFADHDVEAEDVDFLITPGRGIRLEHCGTNDDGRACALEYNVVAWGRTELPPQAGLAEAATSPRRPRPRTRPRRRSTSSTSHRARRSG